MHKLLNITKGYCVQCGKANNFKNVINCVSMDLLSACGKPYAMGMALTALSA